MKQIIFLDNIEITDTEIKGLFSYAQVSDDVHSKEWSLKIESRVDTPAKAPTKVTFTSNIAKTLHPAEKTLMDKLADDMMNIQNMVAEADKGSTSTEYEKSIKYLKFKLSEITSDAPTRTLLESNSSNAINYKGSRTIIQSRTLQLNGQSNHWEIQVITLD